jgi:hypothetical protein
MKKIADLYIQWIEKYGSIKLSSSLFLFIFLAVLFNLTDNNIFLWLFIIPCSYLIPFILTTFLYAWIVRPIVWLIAIVKKTKSK